MYAVRAYEEIAGRTSFLSRGKGSCGEHLLGYEHVYHFSTIFVRLSSLYEEHLCRPSLKGCHYQCHCVRGCDFYIFVLVVLIAIVGVVHRSSVPVVVVGVLGVLAHH